MNYEASPLLWDTKARYVHLSNVLSMYQLVYNLAHPERECRWTHGSARSCSRGRVRRIDGSWLSRNGRLGLHQCLISSPLLRSPMLYLIWNRDGWSGHRDKSAAAARSSLDQRKLETRRQKNTVGRAQHIVRHRRQHFGPLHATSTNFGIIQPLAMVYSALPLSKILRLQSWPC